MSVKLYQVDAFTRRPFAGNPAAVCLLDEPAQEGWMQAVAREMNLSETAFVVPQSGLYGLRWFTPLKEVRLCGHATLASAHVLWESGRLAPGAVAQFDTLSGRLTAEQRGDWIELNFPARELRPAEPLPGLLEALNARPVYVGLSTVAPAYLLVLESEQAVRELRPDFTRLAALPVRSVMVTARADTAGIDFVSRYFAPAVGINEDPVTGSAHCYLTPYWAERLGKHELNALQVSQRGGALRLRLMGERVGISGQAVTILVGDWACAVTET